MRFSFKKITSAILLTSFLATTGFGCAAPSAEQAASIRAITINYWTVFDDVSQLRQMAKEYQLLRPQVTINIRQIRYEEYDKLFTNALADDVGPDIISMHVRNIKKYQNRLSPMPAKVTTSFAVEKGQYVKEIVIQTEEKPMPTVESVKANYVTGVAQDAIINNQIYGLPLVYDSMALYYNKTLLDQAGVATPPTTWDELVAAVKASTKYDANNNILQSGVALGTGRNIDNAADILALIIMQNGYKVIQGNTVMMHRDIEKNANHPTLKSLSFFTDFAQADKAVYSWNTTQDDAFQSFVRNKSVFYFGYAYDYSRIKSQNPQMVLESIPIPQLDPNKTVNISNYWLESVVKKSKNKEYAWDFIRFLTLPNNIKKYSEAVKIPSPLREHIGTQKANPALTTFSNQSLTAENWYRGQEWDTAKKTMQKMIDDYNIPIPEGTDATDYQNGVILRSGRALQQTM